MKPYAIIGGCAIVFLVGFHIAGQISGNVAAYSGIGVIVALSLGAAIRKKLK